MQIPVYHIDAFTDKIFSGNPAAVCLLTNWLKDQLLSEIAKENNLPVTAFLVKEKNHYQIRWITPEYELDLCGHGSLAASYVIFNFLEPTWTEVSLHSPKETLQIYRQGNNITLNFPAKLTEPCVIQTLEKGLGVKPLEVHQFHHERCFAVLASEEDVKKVKPNIQILKTLPHRGITITAKGKDVDIVSRTFYPQKMISEDPATGASHCLLVPYWSSKLNKTKLTCQQVSERGGELTCEYQGDRVLISSKAVLFMQGMITIL